MNQRIVYRLSSLLCIAYAGLVLVYFLTTADIYFYQSGTVPVPPIRMFVASFAPMMLVVLFLESFRRHPLSGIIRLVGRNVAVIGCFALVVTWGLLLSLHPTAFWGSEGYYIKSLTYNFLIFGSGLLLPLFPSIRDHWRRYALAALVCLLGSVFYDLFNPGTMSKSATRAAGFAINANLAALLLTQLAAVSLEYKYSKRKRDIPIIILVGLGVFSTLSRGGMLLYLALLVIYGSKVLRESRASMKRVVAALGSAMLIASVLFLLISYLLQSSEMFSARRAQERLAMLSGERELYASDDARLGAARESLRLINEAPIFGHGTAFNHTMAVSPHNLYLQQWVNNGLFGLIWFVLLLVVAFRVFRHRGFAPGEVMIVVTALASLFSHNTLDQRPFLVLFGLLLSVSLSLQNEQKHVFLLAEEDSL
ncbi:MAG: O-antigen ligase family protein [Bdellovibrionales bacterium]|nr:O-antigen ligase family protein [Bdellovibrionales bacterium]